MYLNILYSVIAGKRSMLLADVDIFEHVLCGNILCYQFVLRCVFIFVACLFFRLNNKSSQKLVQDRKSPVVPMIHTQRANICPNHFYAVFTLASSQTYSFPPV